jgi:hypothetical protein
MKGQYITRQVTSDGFQFVNKTLFSDLTLKDGQTQYDLFKNSKDEVLNYTGSKNPIASEFGSEINGFHFNISRPDYGSFVFKPTDAPIVQALERFRNTSLLTLKISNKIVWEDRAMSEVLAPYPHLLIAAAADVAPMGVAIEHNPITRNPKSPVMQFGKPWRINQDTDFQMTINFKKGFKTPTELESFKFQANILIKYFIEKVAMPVARPAAA